MEKWKTLILSRYLGDFEPGEENDPYPILKSSDDIKYDLEGMGRFVIEEISAELVIRGYKVKIDEDGKPKWILQHKLSAARTIENKAQP